MESFSEVRCGTCFAYSPRGQSDIAEESRRLCYALKRGDRKTIEAVADQVASRLGNEGIQDILGQDSTLIPMPGHAPRRGEHDLWVSLRLAAALVDRNLGREVRPILTRAQRVPKSAFAPTNERPTHLNHCESLRVDLTLDAAPQRITVVDDVLTRGATMLGAAARLREAFPSASIVGFAFVRTQAELGEGPIVHPVLHRIWVERVRVRRHP